MRSTLFVILVFLGVGIRAEITVPTPPTPPTMPIISGGITVVPLDAEHLDALTSGILQLDSLTTLMDGLESELQKLRKEKSEVRALLPPATRLNRVYQQSEVDYKATALRRSLGSLPLTGTLSVRLVVNPDGRPEEIEIVSAPVSREAHLEKLVSSWLFVPARKSGKRVRVRTTSTVKLSDD
jgi:hypothetical protein